MVVACQNFVFEILYHDFLSNKHLSIFLVCRPDDLSDYLRIDEGNLKTSFWVKGNISLSVMLDFYL